jgi:LmbE family N-acetylglucosaminyl deacetylase
MRRIRRFPALALLSALALVQAAPARAQALRTEYTGSTALGLELRRLGTAKRVLMIAAHPDDERTEILTTLALGAGAEVAYLSLTRGEGGQNLIGPELQEGLGLIRSEELLAARRLDGARQFFSRAYDYGFSKNADEAFRHWPHDQVLADVVAVIRSYRPDIVVAVFSGTPADGHGQHQASGILAREAFAAAGDPTRFPEQIAAGLAAFTPARLYQGGWRGGGEEGASATITPGTVDPLLGKSYARIAGESRSRHLSQGFGNAGSRQGSQTLSMPFIAGDPLPASGVGPFAGLDTLLSVRAARALPISRAGAGGAPRVIALLSDYEERVRTAVRAFDPKAPGAVVEPLAGAVRALAGVDSSASAIPAELRTALAAERAEAADALWRAADLHFTASAPDQTIVPGQSFVLTLSVENRGDRPRILQALDPELPAGWKAQPLNALSSALPARGTVTRRFRVTVPSDAPVTEPYFLRLPRSGDMYRWPEGVRVGVPFEAPPVRASARAAIAGAVATIETDALYRRPSAPADSAGSAGPTLRVVPAVSVLAEPALAVVPLGAATSAPHPLRLRVHLREESPRAVDGTLRLQLPAGWKATPADLRLRLAPGQARTVDVTVTPPAALPNGETTLRAVFEDGSGADFARGYTLIDYPHIRPEPLYHAAETRVRAFDVRLPQAIRIGYVAGVGDDAPAALRQMGADVTVLDEAALATGDLSRFQAIVTGIRAYEVRPDLLKYNDRLLDFARAGGTLVVQYNRFERVREPFTPYPLTARLQDRVTDEDAPVRILAPGHQALVWPNRITQADFEGWVQERGLYYPTDIDPHFTALLEMNDPGDPPLKGGLLVAPLGRGAYVYTGLALFRQFPEGVPGAYRILANLVSLGVKP